MSETEKNKSPEEVEALKKDVEALAEQNAKLQRELEAREEVMQSLFSYFTTKSTEKERKDS
jgi:regulator of replication initiation timing